MPPRLPPDGRGGAADVKMVINKVIQVRGRCAGWRIFAKYALARHPWDEPPRNARHLAEEVPAVVLRPVIGEVVRQDKD